MSGTRLIIVALVVGLIFSVPAAFFNYIAWGQWNCGLMGFQAVAGGILAALGWSLSISLWPLDLNSRRRKIGAAALVWIALAAGSAFIVYFAGPCPYPSR